MRLALAGLLAAAGLVLLPPPATACSCAQEAVPQRVARVDSIGAGKVAWVVTKGREVSFGVDFTAVYKGRLGSRERITTGGHVSCGWMPKLGDSYLFFLEGQHRGRISTHLCAGNTELATAPVDQVERVTGPPHEPVAVRDVVRGRDWFPTGLRWTLAGLGAAAVVVALVVARRRRI